MRAFISSALATWCFFALTGCSSIQLPTWATGLSVNKGDAFVIDKRTIVSGRLYPSIMKTPDGVLYLDSLLGISKSPDSGKSWERIEAAQAYVAGTAGDGEGVVLDGFDRANQDGDTILLAGTPIKNGRAIGPSRKVPVHGVPELSASEVSLGHEAMKEYTFYASGKGLRLPTNRILLPVATRFTSDRKIRCILLGSDDNGESFRYLSTIASPKEAPWGSEGPSEAAVRMLKNGELLAVMRTGCDARYYAQAMVSARSSDGGESWHSHRMMAVHGVKPDMAVLSNGVVACTAGRPGNQVVFSADDGVTWTRDLLISAVDQISSGYLQLVETEPNRILAVYEQQNIYLQKVWLWEPPPPVDAVFGVFIDVHRR